MKKLYPYFTWAGAIPFVGCAVCLMMGIRELEPLGQTETVLSVYGLIIVTFLAGSHWGQHLALEGKWSRHLPIASNTMAVTLWLAFLLLPFRMLLVTFVVAFIALLFIDQQLVKDNIISRQYFNTRCFVTATVALTLLTVGMVP